VAQRILPKILVVVAVLAAIAIPIGLGPLRLFCPAGQLELVPAIVSVGGPNAATETELVRISLQNHSSRDVALRSVRTSCSCVSASPIGDVTIPAQTARILEFRVNLPDSGTSSTEIWCYVDCNPEPLRCRVLAAGRRELPVLRTVRNGNPTFLALASIAEPAKTVTIETRERKESPPWIARLDCDLLEVEVQPNGVREQAHADDDFVDRTYAFDVRWSQIPSSPEFSGKLTAITIDDAEIAVGILRGSRSREVAFFPSIARLTPTRRSETVFIEPAAHVWALNPKVGNPDWLQADSVASHRGPCLQVSLREGAAPAGQTVTLRIDSDQGLHGELDIIVAGFRDHVEENHEALERGGKDGRGEKGSELFN